MKRAVKFGGWILTAGAFWLFLKTWLAPHTCLDVGGSFNYELWECNDEVNSYVQVGFYELKSFWLFLGSFAVACVLQRSR